MKPLLLSLLLFLPAALLPAQEGWKPAPAPLSTRWAARVSPGAAHPEYPRPGMVRKAWLNLDGLWEYALRPRQEGRPASFDGKILVPFPVESSLSGVGKKVGPRLRVWYRRTFPIPPAWKGKRILLHFGAVDWEARVWVNGTYLGCHRGGYTPFTLDATEALRPGGEQEILLAAWDPTDAGYQPRGKQVMKPRGIWYTPTTGIWRTAWVEPVPRESISRLKLTPDLGGRRLLVQVSGRGLLPGCRVEAAAFAEGKEVARAEGAPGTPFALPVENPRTWSPSSPFLYTLEVTLKREAQVLDRVESYFGMRSIAVKKDSRGVNRLFLNGKPLFQFGTLDQGFWPDGIYTAPTDEALRYDLEVLKKLGFNTVRKHVKIEPARWYWWCDKLGLLVWQDMPSGDRYIGRKDPDIRRVAQSARQFEVELKETMDFLWNHPCLVMWVPFNEGWGQFDTKRITAWIKKYDPTRLVDQASGWTDRGTGDVHDIHVYPGPACPPREDNRAAVLGEFGGLGLPLPGHTWLREKSWGYRSFKNQKDLTRAYLNLLHSLRLLQARGLAAAIYTQTTDVEIEVNGLLTYDRAVLKVDPAAAARAAAALYSPPPVLEVVLPDSREEGQTWAYTTKDPGPGWFQPAFDDSSWKRGPGGFGTKDTSGAVVRTPWRTGEIWLRRTFVLEKRDFGNLCLIVHHDEDAQVYLNGKPAARLPGYTRSYVLVPLGPKASLLKKGKNVLAVHCRQTRGGQYIDAGLVDAR